MSNYFGIASATESRLLKRSCESLIGICSGLVADGELNDREIVFLSTWLTENETIGRTWPGEVVVARIREVLADGMVTDVERKYLVETLQGLVGGAFAETGAVPNGANSLPVNDAVVVDVSARYFCFTGQFLFGTRSACERAVESRGGLVSPSATRKTEFLVIGELASRAWKNTSHGTKIEQALALQSQGVPIQIISEARWVDSLG